MTPVEALTNARGLIADISNWARDVVHGHVLQVFDLAIENAKKSEGQEAAK